MKSTYKSPIRITFDTNTYSPVARPQVLKIFTTGWPLTKDRLLSKKRRIAWLYINWCIRRGRILAGIPVAAFAAEVLPNVDRVAFLSAVGTPKVTSLMNIPSGRYELIQKSFEIGFRVLRGSRIAYGEIVGVKSQDWASNGNLTLGDIQNRQSQFIRHFHDYPLEALRDFGEKMATAHGLGVNNKDYMITNFASIANITIDRYLWREGLAAEKNSPKIYKSPEAFDSTIRHLLADWADFDIAAVHYAYGYDFICTEDKGKLRSDSIFGSKYVNDLSNVFGLKSISLSELSSLCWSRFGFPIKNWKIESG